jgi:hypothetical protein
MSDTASPFDELGLGTPDFGVDFSAPARGLAVWASCEKLDRRASANGSCVTTTALDVSRNVQW